ncbi:MAG: hypothetical protein RL150_3 [Candidatus Parcubacteria bacterium]|jgi:hypothetical protein
MKFRSFFSLVALLAQGTVPTQLVHYWWNQYQTTLIQQFIRDLSRAVVSTVLGVGTVVSLAQTIVYAASTNTFGDPLKIWPVLILPGAFVLAWFFWMLPMNSIYQFGLLLQRFINEYVALERLLQEAPAGNTAHERANLHLDLLHQTAKNPADSLRLETCRQLYQAFGLIEASPRIAGPADTLG